MQAGEEDGGIFFIFSFVPLEKNVYPLVTAVRLWTFFDSLIKTPKYIKHQQGVDAKKP